MPTGKRQKYFISRKEVVTIKCIHCGRVRNLSVARLKDTKHSMKINCSCEEIFEVDLEFRQHYRKKTQTVCTLRALSTPKKRARQGIITDESAGGLLLQIAEEIPIQKNDQLIVSYRPDGGSLQEMERIISVRHYDRGHRIGGAFIDMPAQQEARSIRTATRAIH
jgi:hypothetical protein